MMEQHRIVPMLHASTFIVISLKTGTSPVVGTTLVLRILQTYTFELLYSLWGYLK